MAGAVAAGLWLVSRRLGVLATVAAVVMAAGPGDVLAGLVLGAVVTVAGYLLLRELLAAIVARLATTRLRPLLTTTPAGAGSAAVS
jgi:hypothetical protein